MKIAIFTDSFFPYISGVTTAISNRARGLIEKGNEVAVFRPKPSDSSSSFPLSKGLTIYDLPISIPSSTIEGLDIQLPLFFPAYKAVREFKPDVFHVDTQWGVGWQGIMCAKIMKKPLFSTFHTFWSNSEYLKYFPFSNNESKRNLMWNYMLFFHNRFEVVCCPSRLVEEKLIERGLESETTVIPNCIKEVDLKSEGFVKNKRKEYKAGDAPNLIFVGRVSHEKSLEKVIKSYHKISSTFPDSELIIIGDGDAKKELQKMTDNLDLLENVKFLGKISNDKIMEENLFRLGDIFVTASKTENHPVSLLEAQAFGLPIVAPEAAGIPEIVKDKKNGLLYSTESSEENEVEKLASRLEKLLEDEELRKRMKESALESSRKHTAKRVAGLLEKLYRSKMV